MSKNYNRVITKNVTNNGTYKKEQLRLTYPPWSEWNYCLTKTGLYSYQRRMYKSWKYNRKKQYKQKRSLTF